MRYLYFVCLFFLFIAKTRGQNLDSIIHIKPIYSIKKDTLYGGRKFNQINRDQHYRLIALGNTNNREMKNGYWVYLSADNRKQICIGKFKKGLKHGWWYWNADECNIKFKNGKEIKRRYHF